MSFEMNFNRALTGVQASAKTCPGGGGNTGWFDRRKKEEEEENNNIFAQNYPDDTFEKENTSDEMQNQSFLTIILNLLSDIFNSVKNFFLK